MNTDKTTLNLANIKILDKLSGWWTDENDEQNIKIQGFYVDWQGTKNKIVKIDDYKAHFLAWLWPISEEDDHEHNLMLKIARESENVVLSIIYFDEKNRKNVKKN